MDKILLFAPAGQYLTEENALDTVRLDRIAAVIRAKGFALRELPSVRSVETRFASRGLRVAVPAPESSLG